MIDQEIIRIFKENLLNKTLDDFNRFDIVKNVKYLFDNEDFFVQSEVADITKTTIEYEVIFTLKDMSFSVIVVLDKEDKIINIY